MYLKIHVSSAESYDLDSYDLDEAIEAEAKTVSEDAGAELLTEGTDEERAELERDIVHDAATVLRKAGDRYIDPTGVVWSLVEEED